MKMMPVSQRVLHEKYGLGTITEADRFYTTIDFDKNLPDTIGPAKVSSDAEL